MAMAMDWVSNPSPLVPCKRKDLDSVENDKDFATPIKKLNVYKDDLVREEHNADSVTSLSDREIFDIWCKFWKVTYKDENEREYRFGIFQKALKPPITKDEVGDYCTGYADRTEEELNDRCAYVFKSDIEMLMNPKVKSPSDREIFDIWCEFWEPTYKDENEKEYRFDIFQKALKPPITEDEVDDYYTGSVDRTEEELNGRCAYIFKSDIEMLMNVKIFKQSEEELYGCIEKSEKDFVKLKDSVAEEDNTDSNPKVKSLSDQEIFDIWCEFWEPTYKDENEKEYRFGIFQKALKPPITEDEVDTYYAGYADRTEEELNGRCAYIFKSDIEMLMNAKIFKQSEEDFAKLKVAEEDNTDSYPKVTSLSNREVFDKWCKFWQVTYKDKKEKEYRFGIFQKALRPPIQCLITCCD